MKRLQDTPEGREFILRCVDTAADLGLFLAGEPEERVLPALARLRDKVEKQLTSQLGADVAHVIACAFIAAVHGRKREIEIGGAHSMENAS